MKKIVYILLFLLFVITPSIVFGSDCIYEEVDCTGKCGSFVDTNIDNDNYCDRGDVTAVTPVVGRVEVVKVEPVVVEQIRLAEVKGSVQNGVIDTYEVFDEEVCGSIADFEEALSNEIVSDEVDVAEESVEGEDVVGVVVKKSVYNFIPITLVLVFLYFVTYILSRKKIISLARHRLLWNLLLLVTFLLSGLSGIFLVMRINYGISFDWLPNLLYLHVETGIAMAVISVFHILWHWPYFRNIVKIYKGSGK